MQLQQLRLLGPLATVSTRSLIALNDVHAEVFGCETVMQEELQRLRDELSDADGSSVDWRVNELVLLKLQMMLTRRERHYLQKIHRPDFLNINFISFTVKHYLCIVL